MDNISKQTLKYSGLLLLAALIWGFAFSFQSLASSIGAFTFNALRTFLAIIALLPVIKKFSGDFKINKRTVIGGIICGAVFSVASNLQQSGISYTTPGKAAFITTLYLVIVAVASLFLSKKVEKRVLVSVVLAMAGLYFICMKEGDSLSNITKGDILLLFCAFMFAGQILITDHYVSTCDPLKFTLIQFITHTMISLVLALIFDKIVFTDIKACIPSILYCGIMSSGVAYTLQNVGQKYLVPTVATICLSFESVFSVLGEGLIFGTTLSGREAIGCIIMFVAVILAQIDPKAILKKKKRQKAKKVIDGH